MTKGRPKNRVDLMLEIKGGEITLRARMKSLLRILIILCLLLLILLIMLTFVKPELWANVLKLYLSLVSLFSLAWKH